MRKTALLLMAILAASCFVLTGCKEEPKEAVNPWIEVETGISYVDSTLGQGGSLR